MTRDRGTPIPTLSPEAERLLRWLNHHRQSREGEALLHGALTEVDLDQGEFGRVLLELARERYIRFQVT